MMNRPEPVPIPAGPGRTTAVGPGVRQGLWLTYGLQDGLPSSTFMDIVEDRQGTLWLASSAGVTRCDGESFTTFCKDDGLPGNRVMCMAEDTRGHLWFGTDSGLCRYDGEHFLNFTAEHGLLANEITSVLADRRGRLWVTYGDLFRFYWADVGVSCYDDARFTHLTTADGLRCNRVGAAMEDQQGRIWFGTDTGVCAYDGDRFIDLDSGDHSLADRILCLMEDRQGHLWFGTRQSGVWRYRDGELVNFTERDGLGSDGVMSLAEDRAGHLWFGTWQAGVTRYDGGRFANFSNRDGLGSNIVTSIIEDRSGYLWFAMHGGGISRHDGVQFSQWTVADGLANDAVMSVMRDSGGRIWFGTQDGVHCHDGQELLHFGTDDGLVGPHVRSLLEDDGGNIWLGTNSGVGRYDGRQFDAFISEVGAGGESGSYNVERIYQDRRGHLWFGTYTGLFGYDGEQWTAFAGANGLPDEAVLGIFENPHGNIWFASTKEIYRYDGQRFEKSIATDELPAGFIVFITEDRNGYLWIASRFGGGISRYDGERWTNFTSRDGLAYDDAKFILEDRDGRLWIATFGGGVSHFDGLVFQTLSKRDGLVHDAVHEIVQDDDGDLWIATEGGLTRYHPLREPPTCRILRAVADRRYDADQQIRLNVSQRFVTFEFQGVSATTSPERMAYVFQLDGHDEDWQPVYEGRVEYHDLPQGDYTFRVKAVDRDLNYSEAATVQLSIVPDERDQRIDELEGHVRERTADLEAANERLGEQNRTLVAEQALQRVRAEALSMQQSDDLRKVLAVAYREIRPHVHCLTGLWAHMYDEGPGTRSTIFASDKLPEGTTCSTPTMEVVGDDVAVWAISHHLESTSETYQLWREGEDWDRHIGAPDCRQANNNVRQIVGVQDPWPALDVDEKYQYGFPFAPGDAGAETWRALSESEVDVVRQFVGAVKIGYLRYLDFANLEDANREIEQANQRLEDQNRDLLAEQALERVRTQVASMQESADLVKVINALTNGMTQLGVPTNEVRILLVDESEPCLYAYSSEWSDPLHVPMPAELEAAHGGYLTAWREGRTLHRYFSSEDVERLTKGYAQIGYSGPQLDALTAGVEAMKDERIVDVPFAHGMLGIGRPGSEPFADEHVHLMERLTEVFALGYQRYLDLQAAEARARQANVDTALERVRSEALSMRESNDLKNVLAVAYRELRAHVSGLAALAARIYDEEAGTRRSYWSFEALPEGSTWTHPELVIMGDVGVLSVEHATAERPAITYERWRDGEEWQQHITGDVLQRSQAEARATAGMRGAWPAFDLNERFEFGFPFAQGEFGAIGEHAFTEEETAVVRRFAEAAVIGYQRFRDFVTLEQANQAIEQATRHKSDFLARMSHDLRTPMNAIIGYTRILLRRARDVLDARQLRNLENIETSADTLLNLINEILDLSRIEAGRVEVKPEAVDLKLLTQECAATVEPLLNADVKLETHFDDVGTVRTDPDLMRRIVMNLLGNAVKFTERGHVRIALKQKGGCCELVVADTGVGIPPEELPHVFDEFRQVEGRAGVTPEGSGLGLAIVKKTVELLGGAVAAESEPGSGTTFTVRVSDFRSSGDERAE